MGNHRTTSTYSESFKTFLAHTDEKPILLQAITKKLQTINADSLLDIGAGNGDLAIPLSKVVKRYVALEQKADFAERLREAGLEVIEQPFPCAMEKHFDAVLLSHSLPSHDEKRSEWSIFLDAAWKLLKERGHLLIVTFDEDSTSDWNQLVKVLGFRDFERDETRFKFLKKYLQNFGQVEQETITTHVRTATLEDMLRALAFVWSDGQEQHLKTFLQNPQIAKQIRERYLTKSGFTFPFRHYLLDTSKQI
jgi:SAM-dependent methyltransferase